MKLLELEIEHYGIFSDRLLEFGPGFQLIYGENEAGKSTLLQLIRDVLFGFPHQTSYAFPSHPGEVAASALIELADGTRARFRRRKGRKNQVMGQIEPDGESVDAHRLARMLGSASAELYHNVFGFSLSELTAGEKGLAQANLNDALYGGGLGGLANFQRIQSAVRADHESLFAPRATTKTINRLLRDLKESDKKLRASVVKPHDYEKLKQASAEKESRVEQVRETAEELRVERAHADRLSRALGPWCKWKAVTREIADLDVPEGFPSNGLETYTSVRQRIDETNLELVTLENEYDQISEKLAKLQPCPELLQREPEVEILVQRIGQTEGYRRDIPLRTQEAATLRKGITEKLKELDPAWGIEDLSVFQPTLAQREQLDTLAGQRQDLEFRNSELAARLPDVAKDVEKCESRLVELENIECGSTIDDLVRREPLYEHDQQRRNELNQELQKVEAQIETLRAKLDAPLSQRLTNAEKLSVPMEPTIQEFRASLHGAEQVIQRNQQRLDEVHADAHENEIQLDRLDAQRNVPDIEQLLAQRARRDAGWQMIRRKYIRGKDVEDEIARWLLDENDSLADAYEREKARADQMADDRQANAEIVARREQLIIEKERLEKRVAGAKAQLEKDKQNAADLHENWNQLWSPCKIQPLSPDAMLNWLRLHGQLLERLEEQSVLRARCQEVNARLGDYEDELAEALPDSGDSPEQRLADARSLSENARLAKAEKATLNERLDEKRREHDEIQNQLDELSRQIVLWEENWRQFLSAANFPSDWTQDIALKVLLGIGDAQQEFRRCQSLEKRVDDMQRELDEFGGRVREICGVVATDLLDLVPEAAIAELDRRVESHKRAELEKAQLQETKASLRERKTTLQARRDELEKSMKQLFQDARVSTPPEFERVAELALRKRELVQSADSLWPEIHGIRGSEDEQRFREELDTANADQLAANVCRLDEQIGMAEREHQKVVEDAALARDRLQRLDGDSSTLRLLMDIESHRGELTAAVDQYIPLVFCEALMRRAVEEFERRHQPEMLRDVQQLFGHLTCGRYVAMRRKLDEQGSLLVEDRDGTTKEPWQLSRGTREQLYLAIRLAYIKHYCRKSEPLPLVMDDVLVNFDDDRVGKTIEVLSEIAETLQVFFLTCRQDTVDRVQSTLRQVEPFHLRQLSLDVVGI